MTLDEVNRTILTPAAAWFPYTYDTPAARQLLLATGMQESRFIYRRQMNDGPAMGFWQFELGGAVKGVMGFKPTRTTLKKLCGVYGVAFQPEDVWEALGKNDIIAACFARALLRTDPHYLPARNDPDQAWEYYIRNWRPGKPHWPTWNGFYKAAGDIAYTGG